MAVERLSLSVRAAVVVTGRGLWAAHGLHQSAAAGLQASRDSGILGDTRGLELPCAGAVPCPRDSGWLWPQAAEP